MKIVRQMLTVGAVAGAILGIVPACAENDQTVFVKHVLTPPTQRQNDNCIYQPDPTATFLAQGTIDISIAPTLPTGEKFPTYRAAVLVGNQMRPTQDPPNGRSESNRVHINGAVVRVTDTSGGLIREFTSLTSGTVDPGINGVATYGLAFVNLIDVPTGQLIAQRFPQGGGLVIANFKLFGKSLGGMDVETGEFSYPIGICNECLVSFKTGDDPAVPGVDCNKAESTTTGGATTAQLIQPCNFGQDEFVPCELCKNDFASCRGQAP